MGLGSTTGVVEPLLTPRCAGVTLGKGDPVTGLVLVLPLYCAKILYIYIYSLKLAARGIPVMIFSVQIRIWTTCFGYYLIELRCVRICSVRAVAGTVSRRS